MQDLFFCVRGGFGLQNTLARIDPRRPMPPFAILASGKTYGDYQILFDLQTNFDFKTYAHDFRWSELEKKYLNKRDFGAKEYIVNTLDA